MKSRRFWIQFLVCFAAALLLIGCAGGTKVTMKQDSYTPGFKASDYGRLKGKTVLLYNFTNSAANTKSWGYYSPDQKIYYEAPVHLESYLWYCFQKAFQHAGIKVLDQGAYGGAAYHPFWWAGAPPPQARVQLPSGTIEFQLVLTSMTDQESKFQVMVYKGGEVKFQKDFTATQPPAATADKAALEKRAYSMVDQMVTEVFKDKEFQKAL